RPGSATNANLTTTELTAPAISVLSSGTPLPAPVVIGAGGRMPPASVIDDDATGSVETSGSFDATIDGIDFYENLQAMLGPINNPVAVGPTNTFGETPVLGDNGASAALRTARGGILGRRTDFNPERMILADDVLAFKGLTVDRLSVRDTFDNFVVGVMDYNFGNFMVQLTERPTVTKHNM